MLRRDKRKVAAAEKDKEETNAAASERGNQDELEVILERPAISTVTDAAQKVHHYYPLVSSSISCKTC